jgi:hypothetical protein
MSLIAAQARAHLLSGGSSYGLLFAAEGSSAIVLVDEGESARETNILMFMPFVSVYYMHRQEEEHFSRVLYRAMGAAAARMAFAMPDSPVFDRPAREI